MPDASIVFDVLHDDGSKTLHHHSNTALSGISRTVTSQCVWAPQKGQQEYAIQVDGIRELLYGGSRGGGKALALDTPLPTPTGWTSMGEVKVGDVLLDSEGNQCSVIYTTDVQIGNPCCKVYFDCGESVFCDEDHLWVTFARYERYGHCGTVRSTKEIRDTYNKKTSGPIDDYTVRVRQTWLRGGKQIKEGYHHHRIVSIINIKSIPVRCIQVDSPDHTYLCTKSMIPTHNTEAGLGWLLKAPHFWHSDYRALVIRRNADDLSAWIDRATKLYGKVGGVVTGKPPVITFPHGPVFRLGHLKDEQSYTKYQGHEYHKMLIEELTQIQSESRYLNLIASCRSTSPDLPAQIFATTNPDGPGHSWVKRRWKIGKNKPNEAYRIPKDGRLMMFCPATIDDNPQLKLNDPSYELFLESLPEPYRSAWRYGSWDIYVGQMFDLNENHIIDPIPIPDEAPIIFTFDWGFGKPYAACWFWVDNDNRLYHFAELYGCDEHEADKGLRETDSQIAAKIVKREHELGIWGRAIHRLCDPTCFNRKPDYKGGGQGPSTAEEFAKFQIYLAPGDPDRKMKIRQFRERLLVPRNPEGKVVGHPMLLVYKSCVNFIRTIPELGPDSKNPEDVDSSQEDHIYDSACHAVMSRPCSGARFIAKIQQGGGSDVASMGAI